MEQGRDSLKGDAQPRNLRDSLSILAEDSKNKNQRLDSDQLIYNELVEVGGDWLESSGGEALTQAQYDALYRNGFVSQPSEEVLAIFFDWEDYQEIAAVGLDDRNAAKKEKEARFVEAIKDEFKAGLLPDILLYETHQVSYCDVAAKRDDNSNRKIIRYEFGETMADDDQLIRTYCRYVLADYLLKDRPSNVPITEERKINIAVGFNINSCIGVASFNSSVRNSSPTISEADIERAAEEFRVYPYVFNLVREKHLKELRRAAEPVPEELAVEIGAVGLAETVAA